jgi:beta-glucosidase
MKKTFVLCIIVFLFGAYGYADDKDFEKEVPFQPFEPPVSYETAVAKAERIITKMSLEEKIEMIGGHSIFFTRGYEKYGIPTLRFSDATQGVSLIDYKDHLEKSVAFPAPLALTSTWNIDLSRSYAKSVGEECRAGGIAVLLGPGMNIYRISQCGRNFEYFGEDPFLAARMIENYVVGLQNTGTIATLKHFIANNSDFRRRTSNSVVSERALREIYAPAFEAGINAGALAVMTAYNQVNGEYSSHSKYVISKLLREDLGFKWLVMSDWLSIWDAEKAIKSGLDLDMPGETEDGIYDEDDPAEYLRREAPSLIQEGKVKEEDIDRMVKSIMATAFAMRFDEITVKDTSYLNNYDKHVEVALDTAREGIVLLKNDNQTLPLNAKKGDVILVTGEYVDKLAVGGGAAYVIGFDQITLLDALEAQFGENVKHIESPTDEEIAKASIVIYSAGTKDSEGSDISFDLPEEMNTTISRIAKLNAKTVVVMNTGGGKNMSSWNNEVAAILYSWYPGQVGNQALAEIISGVTNPSGKLPITIERDFKDSPGYPYLPKGEELYTGWDFDMDMDYPVYDITYNEGVFVGYRWYEHKNIQPLYAFGHGLSYSTFEYANLKTNAENYTMDDAVLVKVEVTNTGEVDGKEIVQLYVKDLEATVERPVKELKDFQKVHLKAGQKETVYFTLKKRDFAFWDENTSSWKVEPGKFEIQVGASSADIKLKKRISVNCGLMLTSGLNCLRKREQSLQVR